MIVKRAHSRIPKKFLEEEMKDYPGGTWISLESVPEKEGVSLVCISYKYKVLTFIREQVQVKKASHINQDFQIGTSMFLQDL